MTIGSAALNLIEGLCQILRLTTGSRKLSKRPVNLYKTDMSSFDDIYELKYYAIIFTIS